MAPSIFTRHPRYSIACGVGLLLVIMLQLGGAPSYHALSAFPRLYPPAKAGFRDVAWRLRKSEKAYQEMVTKVRNHYDLRWVDYPLKTSMMRNSEHN